MISAADEGLHVQCLDNHFVPLSDTDAHDCMGFVSINRSAHVNETGFRKCGFLIFIFLFTHSALLTFSTLSFCLRNSTKPFQECSGMEKSLP